MKDIVVLVKCCVIGNQASSRPACQAPLTSNMCPCRKLANGTHTQHHSITEATEAEIASPADHGGGISRQLQGTLPSSHRS